MDIRQLKSKITLAGLSTKAFGNEMGWKVSTSYRKVNGRRPLTVPEVIKAGQILQLTPDEIMAIFFKTAVPEKK